MDALRPGQETGGREERGLIRNDSYLSSSGGVVKPLDGLPINDAIFLALKEKDRDALERLGLPCVWAEDEGCANRCHGLRVFIPPILVADTTNFSKVKRLAAELRGHECSRIYLLSVFKYAGQSFNDLRSYVDIIGDDQAVRTSLENILLGDGEQPIIDLLQEIQEPEETPSKPLTGVLTGGSEVWGEPVPLPDGLSSVKSLQSEMISGPLRGWLMDIADRMQIPPDFPAAAAIVALGSIIGRACGIHPKRYDDWLVVPNLWGGVVGRPSLMKSPAVTEALKPLARLEAEAREQHEAAMLSYSVNSDIQKLNRGVLNDSIRKALKDGKDELVQGFKEKLLDLREEAPVRRRYQTQDATVEKIGELLNENPRGILVSRDELIGWLRTLERDGREGDRAFYLEAWNGTRSFTYDRIGRGTLDVLAVCISIFGTITPGPLSSYVYQATRGGKGDDGLLQRFQVFVWPDAPAQWNNVDRFPDTKAKVQAWNIFKALAEQEIPAATTEDGAEIPALRFSLAGQEIFDAWRDELEKRLRGNHGLHPALESHLTKYRSLMPSLALIFHLVDVASGTASGPVSDIAAAMAADWCDYLESHACRIYGGTSMPGMDAAREILKHIQRGAIQDGCTVRNIWRPQWSRLTSPEEVRPGLDVLEQYGWLIIEKKPTGNPSGGRPSEVIRFNPRIKI
jgi:putative DNA primase/helicase